MYYPYKNNLFSKCLTLSLGLLFIIPLNAQSDLLATCQTQSLFNQLNNLSSNYLLFGHENTTLEGIGWEDLTGSEDRSDCKDAVGDYPAVYGFDFVRGFIYYNHVIKAYEKGSIITFSDHAENFLTGGASWSVGENVVAAILDNSTQAHQRYIKHLDKTGDFFNNLKDSNNEFIPVIYRPLHENSGDWFWWGAPYCSPTEFVDLWQFTVNYLRNDKGIHHVLYAYSPSDPAFRGGYGERYPGDEFVDIVGFDSYEVLLYEMFLKENSHLVITFAEAHGKIPALTEFGVNGGIQYAKETDWFTNTFLKTIKEDTIARKLAFALTWRNDRPDHHWIPLQGEPNHEDFVAFYEDEFTVFSKDLPDIYDCDQLTTITEVNFDKKNDLIIFPNPVSNDLQIEMTTNQSMKEGTISIFDELGRLVQSKTNFIPNTPLDVQKLEKGFYFLQLRDLEQNKIYNGRFVKL